MAIVCWMIVVGDYGRAWEHGTSYKSVGRTVTINGQPLNDLGLVVVAWMAFTYGGVVWEQPLLVKCGGGLCYGAVAGMEVCFRCMCVCVTEQLFGIRIWWKPHVCQPLVSDGVEDADRSPLRPNLGSMCVVSPM